MKTCYFHPPVSVQYRGDEDWHQALALGVRRAKRNTDVLILERDSRDAEQTAWVPRSRIRAADASLNCCAAPG